MASGGKDGDTSPVPSIEGKDGQQSDASAQNSANALPATNGADEDAASEAETLIDSPVKRREAERKQQANATNNGTAATNAKSERPQKSRIGSLPVPQDDDDEVDSTASPMQSTGLSVSVATSNAEVKDEEGGMMDDDADAEGSDVLSSAQSSVHASRESSPSRALSENPEVTRKDGSPSNPRKRKHRASSVDNLPSKRRSMDPPTRRKRRGGLHSDEGRRKRERSSSPKSRGHRRDVSTQSAIDGGAVDGASRKRRGSNFPTREPKSARGWEESDASSETTSRGNDETKRPRRGIGRSTSNPGGRSVGQHKRHVNKYGFTKLAEACEDGDLDLVKELREKDPESLEVAEFAQNKPLQIAALNGNAEVVAYLIQEGAQTDCCNVDNDTPLIDAAENGHLDVVRLLLDAGVDPLRQNLKGQQALDVVTDETEDAAGIRSVIHAAIEDWKSNSAKQRRAEDEEMRHSRPSAKTSKELHFMARTYENLLKLVQNNDRTGVQEFLAARVPVDNTVIAAAAKTGDVYLVNMLLAEMTEKKLLQKAEKPMLAVLGSSHFDMVKVLTELEWFDPMWRDRQGRTWADLAEEKQGPMWKQEKDLFTSLSQRTSSGKARRSSSPPGKRDIGPRRKLAQQKAVEEESDEDEDMEAAGSDSTKRKTPRRLMSRKDLRTAKGGATSVSEDSAAESSDEDAPGEADEAEMKPPDTPSSSMKRRLRSKSQSGSPEMTAKSLRKKRSSSFRSPSGPAMPTLNEEEQDGTSSKAEEAGASAISTAEEIAKKDREEEAKAALELAKQAEEKRKEEEAAEAEAKKAQEEAERKAEEEKREAERKAEEDRKAEVARQEARKAEEERIRVEKEREEQKAEYRRNVLASLPTVLTSLFETEAPAVKLEPAAMKNWFEQHLVPLRILPTRDQHHWILNLQAAPLLGPSGLELFFGPEYSDHANCRATQWMTSDTVGSDEAEIDRFLLHLPLRSPGEDGEKTEDPSFEEELKRTAQRYNAYLEARRKLNSAECKAKIRRVRLQDVLENLNPLLPSLRLEVEFADPPTRHRDEVLKQLEIQDTQDFVGRMKVFWEGSRAPRAVAAGQELAFGAPGEGRDYVRVTDAVVRHEK